MKSMKYDSDDLGTQKKTFGGGNIFKFKGRICKLRLKS